MSRSQRISLGLILVVGLLLLAQPRIAHADTHLNLGIELSGHLIPYVGLSYQSGVDEFGFNLGAALPHDGSPLDISNFGYQGTLYYRYNFINMDIYPGVQIKALGSPPAAENDEMLVLAGGSITYLYSPGGFRFGGGVELNVGLPISALDRFTFPVPYLSVETSFEFE